MANIREEFANTINEIGQNAFIGMTECEKYGMTWGCDECCPVYMRGDCKNKEAIRMIEKDLLNELQSK